MQRDGRVRGLMAVACCVSGSTAAEFPIPTPRRQPFVPLQAPKKICTVVTVQSYNFVGGVGQLAKPVLVEMKSRNRASYNLKGRCVGPVLAHWRSLHEQKKSAESRLDSSVHYLGMSVVSSSIRTRPHHPTNLRVPFARRRGFDLD